MAVQKIKEGIFSLRANDWGGREVDVLSGLLGNLKVEMIPPVLIKGDGKEEEMKGIDDLAEQIYQKHRSLNL